MIPSDWTEEDIGTRLQVLPSVGADMKTITLQVHPRIRIHSSDVTQQVIITNPDGTQNAFPFTRPVFTTNEINVEAIVEDGESSRVKARDKELNMWAGRGGKREKKHKNTSRQGSQTVYPKVHYYLATRVVRSNSLHTQGSIDSEKQPSKNHTQFKVTFVSIRTDSHSHQSS